MKKKYEYLYRGFADNKDYMDDEQYAENVWATSERAARKKFAADIDTDRYHIIMRKENKKRLI